MAGNNSCVVGHTESAVDWRGATDESALMTAVHLAVLDRLGVSDVFAVERDFLAAGNLCDHYIAPALRCRFQPVRLHCKCSGTRG